MSDVPVRLARGVRQGAYHIEYLNKDKNRLVEEPYEPSATDTDGMIKEFLAKLSSDSDNVDYRKPIPNDVEITNYSLDGVLLTLHFDEDYSKMSAVDEVLCRAAVVRTMTQTGWTAWHFTLETHRLRMRRGILSVP